MLKKAIAILLMGMALAGCSRVPAGHVGVKLYLLGTNKGVDTEELSPGRYWIGWNEELYLFPTFTQTDKWIRSDRKNEEASFQTVEGMTVTADLGITYAVDPTKVSILFQKYRKGIEEISDIYLRNIILNALVQVAGTQPIEYVYGRGKGDLMRSVLQITREKVAPIGIIVEDIYWLGEIRLPPKVLEALNDKIQATQKAQQRENEVQQAKAEADKEIEKARGEAESIWLKADATARGNERIATSVTPNLIEFKKIEKWDGVQPRIVSGNSGMILSVPGVK